VPSQIQRTITGLLLKPANRNILFSVQGIHAFFFSTLNSQLSTSVIRDRRVTFCLSCSRRSTFDSRLVMFHAHNFISSGATKAVQASFSKGRDSCADWQVIFTIRT
jgi:hypothetical protein